MEGGSVDINMLATKKLRDLEAQISSFTVTSALRAGKWTVIFFTKRVTVDKVSLLIVTVDQDGVFVTISGSSAEGFAGMLLSQQELLDLSIITTRALDIIDQPEDFLKIF
jgi:hypothetical protein